MTIECGAEAVMCSSVLPLAHCLDLALFDVHVILVREQCVRLLPHKIDNMHREQSYNSGQKTKKKESVPLKECIAESHHCSTFAVVICPWKTYIIPSTGPHFTQSKANQKALPTKPNQQPKPNTENATLHRICSRR